MSNFTTGDWRVEYHGAYHAICSGGVVIAEVTNDHCCYKESLSNALVMAAAQEMYEFIESLQLDIANDCKRDEILAKARGESCE